MYGTYGTYLTDLMKNENSNTRRNVGIAAGTVAGAGLAGAAGLMLRKKKLRIGTPLSKVTVAKHMPIKLRKATGRVVDMAERVDERLREFAAISTEELPYSSGLCGYQDKPNFPSLYLSRSTNPALMKMPNEGQAVVNYKIRRREIDESREDGQPLYGGSIEIRSIEPIAGEEEEGAELESTLFLREFAHPIGKRMKFKIQDGLGSHGQTKASSGFQSVSGRELRKAGAPKEAMRAAVKMRRAFVKRADGKTMGTSATVWDGPDQFVDGKYIRRRNGVDIMYEAKEPTISSSLFLREFAAPRDRDGEGRFASGNIPGPDDFAVAQAARRKKVAAGAGVGALAGGALLARSAGGRALVGRLTQGATRAAGRLIS